MAITGAEVAAIAGVSTATVSMALNGRGNMSEATRKRVLQICKELSYRPNRKSNASSALINIGILIENNAQVLWESTAEYDLIEIIMGVLDEAKEGQCSMTILRPNDLVRKNQNAGQSLFRNVTGVLFIQGHWLTREIEAVRDAGMPYVTTFAHQDSSLHSVYSDDKIGAHQAISHLASLGHKEIGYIGPENVNRYAGFVEAMQAEGFALRDDSIHFYGAGTNFSMLHWAHNIGMTLKTKPARPTAFFCSNDLHAMGLIDGAELAGLKVPRDLSVVGFDRYPFGQCFRIPLTTIAKPRFTIARTAVQQLLEWIDQGDSFTPEQIELPVTLVRGSSTANVL